MQLQRKIVAQKHAKAESKNKKNKPGINLRAEKEVMSIQE
jgi:hypothetical protein